LADHPDYELIKELGQGGMGTVYLAKNRMMDRLEVLKVISKSLLDRPGALDRFQQEIRSAAKLAHQNIVAAYSVLRPGDFLVFAMEYVRGQDLSAVVKARGYLPVTNAAYYIHQVANGLQHAHEKGMVHRDIKPNNLMLAIEGKKHVVKILDFGLAKATSEKGAEAGLTKSGQMLGTPDYIAPEQTLDAHKADIRADIYSLGCTLYFLLSGGPPFQETSLFEILKAHHERDPKPLYLVRPDVPTELAAVVAKMMAKDPTKRYQTPAEVAKALVPFFKPGQGVAASVTDGAASLSTAVDESSLFPSATIAPGRQVVSENDLFPMAPEARLSLPSLPREAQAPLLVRPQSRTATSAGPRKRHNGGLVVGLAFGVLILVLGFWAVVVFRVTTAEGILVVQVNEPDPEFYVDGEKVTVAWQNGGLKAEVGFKPGTRKVELK
jgi:serine/threonine protein kinase